MAIRLPSGLRATDRTDSKPVSPNLGKLSGQSVQNPYLPLFVPKNILPVGENPITSNSPSSFASVLPASTSRITAEPFPSTLARRLPSGENAMDFTAGLTAHCHICFPE